MVIQNNGVPTRSLWRSSFRNMYRTISVTNLKLFIVSETNASVPRLISFHMSRLIITVYVKFNGPKNISLTNVKKFGSFLVNHG